MWFYVLLLGAGAVIGVLLWMQWQKRSGPSGLSAGTTTGMNVKNTLSTVNTSRTGDASASSTNPTDGEVVIYELTEDDVPALMSKEPDVLVMVYADWCGYCKRMAPEFEKAAQSLSRSGVMCARLNSEHNPRAAKQLGVESFPTTLQFHHGQLVQTMPGAMDAEELVTQVSTK